MLIRVVLVLCRIVALLALAFGVEGVALAQPAKPPAAPQAEEEAEDSPRVSMRAFFDLADHRKYQEASLYLDLPKGSEKRGAELAGKLHAILAQRLLVNPELLSPLPHGKPTDGLPAGTEELGKIDDTKGHPVAIRLVRHEPRSADDPPRWVFAQATVARVDALYSALADRWIRDHLPPSLLVAGPLDFYYWQWLAIPLLAVLCVGLGRFLSYVSGTFAGRVFRSRPWGDRFLRKMKKPTSLGWAIAAFWLAAPYLALTIRAEDLVDRCLRALAYLTFFWGLLRTVAVAGDQIALGPWAQSNAGARSVSDVGVRLGKVFVAVMALTVALTELGFPVTSVVAGLGIGGVVLALAAQKTVENLFGSIAILVDRPFNVGDLVRVETVEGRIESIGLRSTRVRTADRSVVIFPNGKLADTRIESLEAREWIRFTARLPLSRTATSAQVKAIVAGITERLAKHAEVRTEDLMVRLAGVGEASYDIDIAAHVDTRAWLEFVRVREELLLLCFEAIEQVGAKLAVPTREMIGVVAAPPPPPPGAPAP